MIISTILFSLSSIAIAYRRDKSVTYARSIISSLVCCALVCINIYYLDFISRGIGLFNGLFHTTTITGVFHIFVFIISGLIILLNSFYPRKIWNENYSSVFKLLFNKISYFSSFILNKLSEQFRILEYPLIVLFVVTGGTFLMTSSDLISIFLAIELQSYGLYILSTMYRNSERATSGGLTYFLLGGLSSCFILLSSAILYSNSGNTSYDGLFIINNISESKISIDDVANIIYTIWYDSYYITFSFIILSVGFLFKISAAPFHFWSPDVYDAIPTVVTTFVAVFAKISILILLLELVYYTNAFSEIQNYTIGTVEMWDNFDFSVLKKENVSEISWLSTLLISSLLSLIIGSILGLTQFRIKRLYAYSTISHIGFILLALSVNSIESVQSFLFYLMQYSMINLNAFFILISIGYSLYIYTIKEENKDTVKNSREVYTGEPDRISSLKRENYSDQNSNLKQEITDKENSPIQLISQIKGYFHINPIMALSLGITLFSFVGIPPLTGFFAKQMVLSSALDNGFVFLSLIAILTSVISAFYYLALIKQMFFFHTDYEINPKIKNLIVKANILTRNSNYNVQSIDITVKNITINSSLTTTIAILTLVTLFFILEPQEWLSLCNILSIILFNN